MAMPELSRQCTGSTFTVQVSSDGDDVVLFQYQHDQHMICYLSRNGFSFPEQAASTLATA